MSHGLDVGAILPDFEMPDDLGTKQRLSSLQGDDAMVLQLGRGEHCPRERAHHRELRGLQEFLPVAFTTLVTVLPNDLHDTHKMKMATGAWWTFLSDGDLEVQQAFGIEEYTDPHHAATVPHTLVLAPGLVVDRVYCGYWFWGRPSAAQLWADLQDLFRRTKEDFDPTTDAARRAWQRSRAS
jgi:peroxiredoxin